MLIPTITLRCAFALAILMGAGGCFDGVSDDESSFDAPGDGMGGGENPDPGDGGGAPTDAQCNVASDCVLAASTCCECPTFAAPQGEGFDAGCDAVDCVEPTGICPAVEATCDVGECVMICSPILVDSSCAFGFVRDAAGCLSNTCVASPNEAVECMLDEDCVQIPADCCGCENGGAERAVPGGMALSEVEALECPSNPSCPGIDVCDASQAPTCVTGLCRLGAAGMNPNMEEPSILLCGTPQLETCPDGSVCLLNANSAKEASDLGVGSCSPE